MKSKKCQTFSNILSLSVIRQMKRGIPISLFVTEPTKDFLFGICYDVLRNPHQCSNGHCYCSDCIRMALEHKCACPICSVKLSKDLLGRNLLIAGLIERTVTCGCPDVFSEFGLKSTCTWSGPLEERSEHITNCPATFHYLLNDSVHAVKGRC